MHAKEVHGELSCSKASEGPSPRGSEFAQNNRGLHGAHLHHAQIGKFLKASISPIIRLALLFVILGLPFWVKVI